MPLCLFVLARSQEARGRVRRCWVLSGFILVLSGFIRLYPVLSGFIRFYLALVGFTALWWAFVGFRGFGWVLAPRSSLMWALVVLLLFPSFLFLLPLPLLLLLLLLRRPQTGPHGRSCGVVVLAGDGDDDGPKLARSSAMLKSKHRFETKSRGEVRWEVRGRPTACPSCELRAQRAGWLYIEGRITWRIFSYIGLGGGVTERATG